MSITTINQRYVVDDRDGVVASEVSKSNIAKIEKYDTCTDSNSLAFVLPTTTVIRAKGSHEA